MFNAVSKTGCNKKGGNEMNILKQKTLMVKNEKQMNCYQMKNLARIDYYIYKHIYIYM